IVLPLIASLAVQLPAISYDYVKEIRVTVQTDVSINVDPIYNVVKSAADVWNNSLKNVVTKLNQALQFPIPLQEIIDEAVEDAMDKAALTLGEAINDAFGSEESTSADSGEEQPKNAKDLTPEEKQKLKESMGEEKFNQLMETLDAENNMTTPGNTDTGTSPTSPAPVEEKTPVKTLPLPESEEIKTTSNVLLSYAPALAIKENVEDFNKKIEDFVKTVQVDDTPSVYYLTATQEYLDKNDPILNRNLAQIKTDIKKQDLPDNLEMDRLAQLRDSMIAYTENLEKSNTELFNNINDIEKFGNVLVKNDQSLKRIAELSKPTWFNDDQNTYIASNGAKDISGNDSYIKMPFFGEDVTSQLKLESKDTNNRLIAANLNAQVEASKASKSSGPLPAPKGLFVIKDGKNENVLNYTAELSGKTNMIFLDVDHDGDEDLIYTLGGDVYLKENYKNAINQPHGDVLPLFGNNNSIDSYVNEGGNAIQGVTAPSDNNESADITWIPNKNPNTVAYEVTLRNSIYDEIDNPTYRYIVLTSKADTPASVDILDKLDMEPPKDGEEDPRVFEMSSPDATAISVKIVNGNYYSNVFALDKDLNKSLESGFAITAPQDCADKEAPFPAIDPAYKIPIMKEFELDSSNSFDTNGKIIEYSVDPLPYENGEKKVTPLPLSIWSDINVMFDSSGDGLPWNDKTNPTFKIGPFTNEGDVGVHEATLHIVDQSRNSSAQKFSMEVFVPNITLDGTISREPVATGKTDPAVADMPFSLMRKRFIYRVYDGELKLISRLKKVATPSISPQQKYYTDSTGAYRIDDLKTKDIITVENKDGVVIAEINPATGDIGALKPGYSTRVNEAVPPKTPTSIDVIDKTGNILGSVYVISDANVDVTLHQNYGFETVDFASLTGVHADDLSSKDDFVMKKFPASDPDYPGGAALVYLKENKYLAFVDTSGNILVTDPRVTLTQKKNNHEVDPLIFELRFNEKPVVEIYIASLRKGASGIIVGPNDVPYTTPRSPSNLDLYGPAYGKGEAMPGNVGNIGANQFIGPIPGITDQNNDEDGKNIEDMLDDLYKRGLIDDLLSHSGFKLELDQAVTRAEFVNVLLNMLCIIPRQPEAYTAYQVNEGFSDMKYADGQFPWFFPYVKEAAMSDRQLIDGYTGKSDLDPVTGLPPFRPNNNITRAETANILIDALIMEGVIDGTKFVVEDNISPWYKPYINASLDLTAYIKQDVPVKNNFILTTEEAQFPNKKLTFKDIILMALRVIDLYDCWATDSDKDGMSDFYEAKHGIDNPNDDPDKDGLTNLQEFEFGSSPVDADTDQGGAKDGDEHKWGTNPLDPVDDPLDDDGDGLTNMAEKLVYSTDPKNPDTDGGCAKDGIEVGKNTNPLDSNDDGVNCDAGGASGETAKEGDIGLYIVPAECDTCPCVSTFDHKADIVPTDTFFSVISNFDETYFFSKSDEVTVESVTISE
ncbi:MAG: S-layer homology domain-containing protein, partial [Candidatus Gracilibacteria bacterium]